MKVYFKIVGIGCIIILNILLVIYTVTLFSATKTAQAEASTLTAKLQAETVTPILPASAVKVSECVPFMGQHWVAPENIPNGPFYLVNKGKILGIEYMFAPTDILGQKQANMTLPEFEAYLKKNNLSIGDVIKQIAPLYSLQGLKFKTFSIEWSSPHAGVAIPHYDVHFYMVDESELKAVCPNATVSDTVSPDVIKNIQQYNIPFPGLPQNTQK